MFALWPDASCDGHRIPLAGPLDGPLAPADPQRPEHSTLAVRFDPRRGRMSATARTDAQPGLLRATDLAAERYGVDGASAWLARKDRVWLVATGPVTLELEASPRQTMCQVRPDEIMMANGCLMAPSFGGGTWTTEIEPIAGWVFTGDGTELAIRTPAVFGVRDGALLAETDDVRLVGTPIHRISAEKAQIVVDQAQAAHTELQATYGDLATGWTFVPVDFEQGWAASSGYPGVGLGHRMLDDASSATHEIAHARFGSRVGVDFLSPGGHWHEALATWVLYAVDADGADALLAYFVNLLRDQRRPSAALTRATYGQATFADMYGKGLTAMLVMDGWSAATPCAPPSRASSRNATCSRPPGPT